MELAGVVEVDVGAADTDEQHGVFRVALGDIQGVHRTARLV